MRVLEQVKRASRAAFSLLLRHRLFASLAALSALIRALVWLAYQPGFFFFGEDEGFVVVGEGAFADVVAVVLDGVGADFGQVGIAADRLIHRRTAVKLIVIEEVVVQGQTGRVVGDPADRGPGSVAHPGFQSGQLLRQ